MFVIVPKRFDARRSSMAGILLDASSYRYYVYVITFVVIVFGVKSVRFFRSTHTQFKFCPLTF